jgi:superfamily II DNA or RNA helicase
MLVQAGQAKALAVVSNTTTLIRAPQPFLVAMRDWLRYPTAQALPEGIEWRPPGATAAWDGWIRLVRISNDGTSAIVPTGLLPWVEHLAKAWNVVIFYDEQRRRPEGDVPDVSALQLRDYQAEAASMCEREGRGVLDMVPRAGKTRTMGEVIRRLWCPFLYVVPTTNIVEQTVRMFDENLGKNFAQIVTPSTWLQHKHAHVMVTTAQSAAALPQQCFDTRDGLAIDEFHHGASASYHRMFALAEHCYFRFGMTGTHFRSGDDALAMHALLSKVLYKVSADYLLARGYLTPLRVIMLEMPKTIPLKGQGSRWTDLASAGLWKHDFRNDVLAWAAVQCFNAGRRTLVLVGSKEQGRQILSRIRAFVPSKMGKWFTAESVSRDRPSDVCRQVIDAFVDGNVQILVGTSMISEGTDLPSSDALVYARGEQAEVTHTQALYRVATAVSGKKDGVIIDVADHHHPRLLEHSESRVLTYARTSIAQTVWPRSMQELPFYVARS